MYVINPPKYGIVQHFLGIRSRSCNRLAQNMRTEVMQGPSQTEVKLTYELMKTKFKCKMINMSSKLREDDLRKLRYYLEGIIPINNCSDSMDILRLLEHEARISWDNINFVKEAMGSIPRLDLVEDLTKYEVKRNLTLLLDFYAKSNLGLDSNFCDNKLGMNMVASRLRKIMIVLERVLKSETYAQPLSPVEI